MNVGTVEAKLAVDASDLDKLPSQAQVAMRRAQQEFEKAAKGITAAMQGAGAGAATAMGQPATAAEKAAATVTAAWKRGSDAFTSFVQSVKSGASSVGSAFSGMGDSAKRVFEVFAGFSLANIAVQVASFVKQGIADLTRMGFEAQRAEESFRRTTEMIGVHGEALADALKAASRGIVDQSDIMLASSKALAQGLAPEQLTKLMEVAVARATLAGTSIVEAFNNITTAVTTQQVRALKSMGIVIDLTRVYEAYAQKIGTVVAALTEEAKSRALADEVIEKSARTQGALTSGVLTNAQQVEKAQATWHNFGEQIGKVFATASGNFQKNSADMITWFQETGSWLDELGVKWNNYLVQQTRGLAGLRTKVSPQQRAAQESLAAALGQVGDTGGTATVKLIDDIAHALGMANEALLRLSSSQSTGAISAAQYAAGLQAQLVALQAVKQPTDDVKHKILELQAAVAGANFTVLQQGLSKALQAVQAQEAALLATVRLTVAAGTSTMEQGAVEEANIRIASLTDQQKAIAQAMVSTREGSVQRVQLEQQVAAIRTQIVVAEIARETVLREQHKAALVALFAARSQAFESSLADDLNAIKQFHDREMAMLQVTGGGSNADTVRQAEAVASVGLAAAQATFDKTEALLGQQMEDTVLMYNAGLFPTAAAYHARVYELAQRMNVALKALSDARVTTETAAFAAILAAATKDAKDTEDAWKVARDTSSKFESANVLGTASSQGRTATLEIAERKKQIADFVGFAEDKEGLITQLYLKESQLRMQQFKTETDDRKAQQLVEQEFMLRTEEQRNTIDERLAGARAATWSEQQFAAGNYFTFLTSQFALALGGAASFYGSLKSLAQDAAHASTTALSDTFFAVMTGNFKSLGDVMQSFWQSMLRAIANFLASAVVRQLLGFFGDLIGLFGDAGGGGWLNGLSKMLGGTGSGGSGSGSFLTSVFGAAGKALGLFTDSATSATSAIAATGTEFDAVTTSIGGTAKAVDLANTGVSNFAAGLGVATSALGVGLGIYGLAQGGNSTSMAISAGGTALSVYSLAQSASTLAYSSGLISAALPTLANIIGAGLGAIAPSLALSLATTPLVATLAPGFAAGITSSLISSGVVLGPAAGGVLGSALGSGVGAGAGGAVGAGVGGATGGAVGGALGGVVGALTTSAIVAAPAIIFAVAGMLAQMADAEEGAKQLREILSKLNFTLDEMTAVGTLFKDLHGALSEANLPATLQIVAGAVRDLPFLQHALALGAEGVTAMTDEFRARTGFLFLSALDAAKHQGIQTAEATAYPWRLADPRAGGATSSEVSVQSDQVTGSGRTWESLFGFGNTDWQAQMWEHIKDITDPAIRFMNTSNNVDTIDVAKLNELLDGEFLTIAVRNAIVDVGKMFGISGETFAQAGLGRDVTLSGDQPGANWRMNPGDSTGFEWTGLMPSVSQIADVQKHLEEAGFVAGNYGKALQDFLTSVDANIVNNPMWKSFTEALTQGDAAGDPNTIAGAVNAAIVASMTPVKFYAAAKAVTDALATQITAATGQLASMKAAGDAQENIDAVAKSIEDMQAAIKVYAATVQLYTALPVEMAAISGDLQAQTAAAIDAWAVTAQSLADSVAEAQTAFDAATARGNFFEIAQTGAALHDAAMARYQAEVKMVQQIEAAIQGILKQAESLVQQVTAIAQWDIASKGSFGTLTALLDSLGSAAGIARTGTVARGTRGSAPIGGTDALVPGAAGLPSVPAIERAAHVTAANLWAVDQALKVIIAALPSAIAKFGSLQKDPSGIGPAVAAGAAPFLQVQQRAIDEASGAAKLTLLQQQASAWNDLANAAIAGVNQWADQTVAAAREATDQQIKGIQEAAAMQAEARAAEIESLQLAIQTAEEFKSAIEGMAAFILQLKVGPLGPGNPMDKMRTAQDAFSKALTAYNAKPTAAGLTGLQGLAQSMLALAEPIFSKPSPQFQALSATTIKQLAAAQALAEAQATDSEVLVQQLDMLREMDKNAAQNTQAQIDALEAGFQAQEEAIRAQAKDAIAGIGEGLANALRDNAAEQAPLIQAAIDAQTAMLDAVTRGPGSGLIDGIAFIAEQGIETNRILGEIERRLALAIPLASGADRVTDGLYHLHDGEMVIPKTEADRIRSAAEGAGLPSSTPEDWQSKFFQPRDLAVESKTWAGPGAAALNDLERRILLLQTSYQSALAHNEYKSRGKIYQNISDTGLVAMQQVLAGQVADLRGQQSAILAKIPTTPPPGTPGTTSGGGSTTPWESPGPAWLSRGGTEGALTGGGGGVVIEEGAFVVTISGVSDPEKVGVTVRKELAAFEERLLRGDLGRKLLARKPLS